MHKSELKTQLTFKSCAKKEYELRAGTTRTYKSIDSLRIKLWNQLNIPLQRVNYTSVPYVYYNEILSA